MTKAATDPADRIAADLPYRPCVGIALFNSAGLVFVGRRISARGGRADEQPWQMPQGGIDAGETPDDAALRELFEETNVRAGSVRLLGQTEGWLSYDLPPDLMKQSWKGRYRGQTQKWFAFGFTGEDGEIDIAAPGDGAHRPEFDAWRWLPLSETPALIIGFKKPVYDSVVTAFSGFETWRGAACDA